MKRTARAAAASLAAALLIHAAGALAADMPNRPSTLEGRYFAEGDWTPTITITLLAPGVYRAVGDHWHGVGLFDGSDYFGVFRRDDRGGRPNMEGASGTQRATLQPDGSLTVEGEFSAGGSGSFETVWRPERIRTTPPRTGRPGSRFEQPSPPPDVPSPDALPKLGDYVYVEELPEALTKVPPEYPEAARNAGIQGTVLVQALVGADGRIKDTLILKSIPGLDEAAMACVRQWVFKPALTKSKPVAVWVAVPVRFTMH